MSHRVFKTALAAVLLISVADACTEQVAGSIGCPALCADESAELRDTILTGAIVLDSSLTGFPRLGESRDITLQSRGDTADVRLVARFDTLPLTYVPTGGVDSPIIRVDSASLIFQVDTSGTRPTFPLTIDAYDVDTTATDTIPSTLVPLFRPDRLIGSFNYSALADTVRLPLDNAKIFAKVRDTLRLRIGLRIRDASSAKLRVLGSGFSPRVRFRTSTDTLVRPDTVFLNSSTPAEEGVQSTLAVYPVIAKGTLPIPGRGQFAIGGLGGTRTYLRFDIPGSLVDSARVVRASLLLSQNRARGTARVADGVYVKISPILASPSITDIGTLMSFLGSPTSYQIDSVLFSPADSGLKSIELVNLVRIWQIVGAVNSSRAIVLQAAREGENPGELDFFSIEAAASLRPRLRLTYVPRRGFGIP